VSSEGGGAPKSGRARIPELALIEMNSTSALKKYVTEARGLCRDVGNELEWGAEEIAAVLTTTGKGNPWLMGVDVKIRARKVAKRARRAADLQRAACVELVKLWQDFTVQFAPALQQYKDQKNPKHFDFDV
jgi:hypothetical protein